MLPADITSDLLGLLSGYVERGDVGLVGVATSNERTGDCLAVAPELLTAAHIAVGIFAAEPTLPAALPVRVGHGLLGPGGRDVGTLRAGLQAEPSLRRRWRDALITAGWLGADPAPDADLEGAVIARALFARAIGSGVDDVIVATSRRTQLPALLDVAASGPLPPAVGAVLAQIRG